jgi:hypothetical protein
MLKNKTKKDEKEITTNGVFQNPSPLERGWGEV